MLRQITIEGFKAIRSATIPLEPFTLFIGRNGVGKSSVLEALQWLRDAAAVGLGDATAQRYGSFRDLLNRRSSSLYLDLRFERDGRLPTHYELSARSGTKSGNHRPLVDFERCVVGRTVAARTSWSRWRIQRSRSAPQRPRRSSGRCHRRRAHARAVRRARGCVRCTPGEPGPAPDAQGKLATSSARPCQRGEVRFVLRRFAASKVLPEAFKRDAAALLARYQQEPKQPPRGRGRPPRSSIDLLYMDPEFEALVTSDDAAMRAVFSLPQRPKNWPRLPPRTQRPKDALREVVDRWRGHGPGHLRDTFDRHPHGWAREIVRKAQTTSRIWIHPIAARLGVVLG